MKSQAKNEEPKRKDREFRRFETFEIRALQSDENNPKELYVEGYAVTFNEPTVLWEYEGTEYKEQVDDKAFRDADMSDVIFNYNHSGKVMARTRNKTLELKVDEKGLYIKARLDGTEEGRKLYEEIQGGYIDRMSFSFTAKESSYDRENHLRTIRKVKKLYDVSAVDIPAYDTTSISTRSYFELEREKEEAAVAAERRKKLILSTYL
ncbi:HK97 family phage prohead protease [Alkalihalobacillus sp. BA299]|uniref:HK97 family phage prohead protease n=1 Tax=Alkalihalobacillus sp. BA299 TaxID=2815938 RepID=UPI001ADAEC41|nr:HK97 family phage prohead protease [Alkalihalobacillus sp. BA299]